MAMLRFELRDSISAGIYQHLALFGPHAPPGSLPHAHWILPSELHRFPGLEHALLLTEVDATALPDRVLDAGPALLSTTTLPIQRSFTQLRLVLHGKRLAEQFDLQRLQPGGNTWLLDPLVTAAPASSISLS
jgi:hypothetical protein